MLMDSTPSMNCIFTLDFIDGTRSSALTLKSQNWHDASNQAFLLGLSCHCVGYTGAMKKWGDLNDLSRHIVVIGGTIQ